MPEVELWWTVADRHATAIAAVFDAQERLVELGVNRSHPAATDRAIRSEAANLAMQLSELAAARKTRRFLSADQVRDDVFHALLGEAALRGLDLDVSVDGQFRYPFCDVVVRTVHRFVCAHVLDAATSVIRINLSGVVGARIEARVEYRNGPWTPELSVEAPYDTAEFAFETCAELARTDLHVYCGDAAASKTGSESAFVVVVPNPRS